VTAAGDAPLQGDDFIPPWAKVLTCLDWNLLKSHKLPSLAITIQNINTFFEMITNNNYINDKTVLEVL